MKDQSTHGARAVVRGSGRPVSSVVAVSAQTSKNRSLRELAESVRSAWDVDDEGEITVVRPSSPPHTILPTAGMPPALPLWQIGVVVNSDELANWWIQQGPLNEETTFAWSIYRHAWVPLRSIPELQTAIMEAERRRLERLRPVMPLLPVPPIVPRHLAMRGVVGEPLQHPGYTPQASAHARQANWTEHVGIPFLRDANWTRRSRAIVALCRHPGAGWVAAALSFTVATAAMLPPHSHGEHAMASSRQRQHDSTPDLARTPQSEPQAREPLSSESISIESLPLVSGANPAAVSRVKPWRSTATIRPAPLTLTNEPRRAPNAAGPLPFDVSTARRVLDYAASRTRHCSNGEVSGTVIVTFQPSGSVKDVNLASIAGDVTKVSCVLGMFRNARVTPFSGAPVSVKKSFGTAR